MRFVVPIPLLALVLLGCPGTPADDDTSVGDDDDALDACGFGVPAVASIDVSELRDGFHADAFARIAARVHDGPAPPFHGVTLEEGACRYLEAAYGSCDPPCAYDEFCTFEDQCAAYPGGISGGTLTIAGLGDPIEIEPEEWSPGEYVGPWGLPDDLFAHGDPISAALEGDEFPPVSLAATGVAPMDPAYTANGFTMTDGGDAPVNWTAGPEPGACVQVLLNGFNAAHGAPLSDIIWCEGPDTGSLAVPQAMVERFPHGETPEVTSGYDWPYSELTRYTRATRETGAGAAQLRVRSTSYFLLSHPEPEVRR